MVAAPIRRVRLTRVSLPLSIVYASSMYIMRSTERTVIELEAESGAVGIGETWGTPEVFALTAMLARGWLGKDALDRHALRRAFAKSSYDNRAGRNGWAALAGLDLAAWDLAGSTLGLPLRALIGGGERSPIDLVSPLPAAVVDEALPRAALQAHLDDARNTQRVVDLALEQARRFGFRSFKYKSAACSADWDHALVAQLREALPEARIRFDPNAGYPPSEAITLCRRLDAMGLEFFEDPTGELEGIARLRQAVSTPVATNMWIIQDAQLAPGIRRGAVDVVLADLFMWGGIDGWRRMARTAALFGLQPAVHSMFETGIATAANLHLAAALGEVRLANDSGSHFLAEDVVTGLPAITNGAMALPAGPGLGVSLDRDRLDRYAVGGRELAA